MSNNYVDTSGMKRLIAQVSENVTNASKVAITTTAQKRSDFYMKFDDVEALPSDKRLTITGTGSVPLEEILAKETQAVTDTLFEEFRRALK